MGKAVYAGIGRKIAVDQETCNGCGICISVCPPANLEVRVIPEGKKIVVATKPNECQGCRSCEVLCPLAAIKIIE